MNKVKNRDFVGTQSYIISQKGAKKLLEYTKNSTAPIDTEMAELVMAKKLNIYVAKFAAVPQVTGESIIEKI